MIEISFRIAISFDLGFLLAKLFSYNISHRVNPNWKIYFINIKIKYVTAKIKTVIGNGTNWMRKWQGNAGQRTVRAIDEALLDGRKKQKIDVPIPGAFNYAIQLVFCDFLVVMVVVVGVAICVSSSLNAAKTFIKVCIFCFFDFS